MEQINPENQTSQEIKPQKSIGEIPVSEITQVKQLLIGSNKHSNLLIILLVLIIIGGGGYLLGNNKNKPETPQAAQIVSIPMKSPTPIFDSTVNWKTYINNDEDENFGSMGFSIKYPNSYEVIDGSDIVQRNNVQIGIPFYFMKITQKESLNNFVLIRAIKDVFNINQDISKGIIFSDKLVNGIVLKQYRTQNSFSVIGTCDAYGYVVEHNSSYYNLYTCDKNTVVFDKMINTFKFLDQSQTIDTLSPADSQTPVAGICVGPLDDEVATVTLNIDTASPRCLKVLSNQQLNIINNTNQTVNITLGKFSLSINPSGQQTISQTFGSYLSPGVHFIKSSSVSVPEIWLQ